MTTNATVNTTIQFRNKFEKQIQACPDALRKKIAEATAKFINNPNSEKCHSSLWLMTYAPEKAVKAFGLELDVPSETDTASDEAKDTPTAPVAKPRISKELVSTWQDELRYQRTLVHPDFLKIEVAESCKDAYTALLNATDAVIAVAAYNACYERCLCSPSEDIERTMGLLACKDEAFFFGGIRSLHFGRAAAIVLKKYHNELHDLLEALWTEEKARRQSNVYTPFANLLANCEVTPDVDTASDDAEIPANKESLPEIIPNEEIAASTSNEEIPESIPMDQVKYKDVSAVNITANEDIFENFLGACQALEEAGYDPNEVIGKMDAIAKILEVSKILKS